MSGVTFLVRCFKLHLDALIWTRVGHFDLKQQTESIFMNGESITMKEFLFDLKEYSKLKRKNEGKCMIMVPIVKA